MSRPLEATLGLICSHGYRLGIELVDDGWAITATHPDARRSQFTPAHTRVSDRTDEALLHDLEVMCGLVLLADMSDPRPAVSRRSL